MIGMTFSEENINRFSEEIFLFCKEYTDLKPETVIIEPHFM